MATKYKKQEFALKDFFYRYVYTTRLSNEASKIAYWEKRALNYEKLYKELMAHTKTTDFNQACYNYHTQTEDLMCQECGKPTSFKTFTKGYSKFCSQRCGTLNEATKEKMALTNELVYGDRIPMRTETIKKKHKESMRNSPKKIEDVVRQRQQTYFGNTGYYSPQQNPEVRKKTENTNIERIGVPTALMLKTTRDTTKEKCISEHGVEYYSQVPEIKEKIRQTTFNNHGVWHYSQSEQFKTKIIEKNNNQYGVDYLFQTEQFKNKLKEMRFSATVSKFNASNTNKIVIRHATRKNVCLIKCTICDKEYEAYVTNSLNCKANENNYKCPICEPNTSSEENIRRYIESIGVQLPIKDRTIIKPKELDMLIPSMNIAVEYNGLMFHSQGYTEHSMFRNKSKDFHLSKTEECERNAIRLFHIFENEWLNPTTQDIWKSIISNALVKTVHKIYGRHTTIKEIKGKEADSFFGTNHMQGKCQSSVNLGLYFEDELVSCMSFGKSRYNKNVEWELLRFANKKYTNVVGGASKLIKHFERTYKPSSLISYANRRWSQGKLYEQLGFAYKGYTKPNYFYFKYRSMTLESRIKYQKHKLKDIEGFNFDSNMSESENMFNNGFRRIYDCGNKIYIKTY